MFCLSQFTSFHTYTIHPACYIPVTITELPFRYCLAAAKLSFTHHRLKHSRFFLLVLCVCVYLFPIPVSKQYNIVVVLTDLKIIHNIIRLEQLKIIIIIMASFFLSIDVAMPGLTKAFSGSRF